jgi:hypothetical protein
VAKETPAPRRGVSRAGGAAALALITAPADKGDGWRHGWVGDTGTGKTWAMRELVAVPGQLVLIHDDSKAVAEFDCPYLRTPAHLEAMKPEQVRGWHAVAFCGCAWEGIRVQVEDVAALALKYSRIRVRSRLVVDELNRAVSEGGQALESDSLREAFTAGRSMGLSVAYGTQTPQRIPTVILDQSSSIGIFRLGPRALNYLDRVCMFDEEMLGVASTLEVGDFVIHRPGHPWDRTIYRF